MEVINIDEVKETEVSEVEETEEVEEVEKDWKQEIKDYFSENSTEIVVGIIKGISTSWLMWNAAKCLNAGAKYLKTETKCGKLWIKQQKDKTS